MMTKLTDRLREAILEDEVKCCFGPSYISDAQGLKENPLLTRAHAFTLTKGE